MNSMDVSILIVNWNTRRYLRECLQSIQDTVKGLEYEVIVVDNASRDGSADMVRLEFPQVRLVANAENLGFARGNNLALSHASGQYLLVMNPDVVLLESTVEHLVSFARTRSDAGMLSPKLLNADRTPQSFYGRIPTLSTIFFLYTYFGVLIDRHLLKGRIMRRERYLDYGDSQEVLSFTDGGAGFCCTLIPRSAVEKVGFMDERFPVFYNDGDFGMRLFQMGYRAYILPHAQAVHYGSSSVKQLDLLTYNQEYVYGLRTFNKKFRGFLNNRVTELTLSLNVPVELVRTLWAILKRKRSPSSLFEPIVSFWKMLRYHPVNARPHIFKLPKKPEA